MQQNSQNTDYNILKHNCIIAKNDQYLKTAIILVIISYYKKIMQIQNILLNKSLLNKYSAKIFNVSDLCSFYLD